MPKLGSWALVLVAFAACRATSADPAAQATSPQAKAEPAPLASAAPTIRQDGDAGPVPEPMWVDTELPPDVPQSTHEPGAHAEVVRDARELTGVSLQAVIRTGEGPSAPRAPEVNTAAIDAAKRKTESRMLLEMSGARARFVLSTGFVLPAGTELRARTDRYGHLLFIPGETTYRIVQSGALRALIGERRMDVAPLSLAEVRPGAEGMSRLNIHVRRVEITSRAARATFELGAVREAGEGSALLCRFLLELVGALPSTPACVGDELPLHAEMRWATGGAMTFDATSLDRRADLLAQDLAVPPPSFQVVTSSMPIVSADTMISKVELAAFRLAPVDLPQAADRDGQPPRPATGLVLVNSSDELRFVWLDGVPVAWVAPQRQLALPWMVRGRYALEWRTFLGDNWEPPELAIVPGTSEIK